MNQNASHCANSQQLFLKITADIRELANATDTARMSEAMLRYLDTFARFHQYSIFNAWLIMAARPNATAVAGFHAWHKLGRFVRQGERGIPILAPIIVGGKRPDDTEEKCLRGFKVVHVFDVSQTDGEPLPEPPNWKSPEKNALLSQRLTAFAQGYGITVTEGSLPGEMQGVSKGGRIELAPTAGTTTLIHEIAHELMHKAPDAPVRRGIRELEAEAVAFVVGRHFGLEGSSSPNYIALHGATAELIIAHLERIRATVKELLTTLDPAD
jgi:hypothetical protein